MRNILNFRLFGYKPIPLLSCLAAAYGIYAVVLPNLLFPGIGAALKLRGDAQYCDWSRVASFHRNLDRFAELLEQAKGPAATFTQLEPDRSLGVIDLPGRDKPFWVRTWTDGPGVAWLIAEHGWMRELEGARMVHEGDVVLDIGAHVGFFVRTALLQGASKVIAVEPDPDSAECLRRNFQEEIASGRVVLVEAGAWSSRGEIRLSLGSDPGWNSMTGSGGAGREIVVPVLPIDDIVAELGLTKVDFIKMDIEGAEKEALRGAVGTLKSRRPRVMIDSYQWAHDLDGLLAEVRRGGDYEPFSGPCEPAKDGRSIVPHMTFYEPR